MAYPTSCCIKTKGGRAWIRLNEPKQISQTCCSSKEMCFRLTNEIDITRLIRQLRGLEPFDYREMSKFDDSIVWVEAYQRTTDFEDVFGVIELVGFIQLLILWINCDGRVKHIEG